MKEDHPIDGLEALLKAASQKGPSPFTEETLTLKSAARSGCLTDEEARALDSAAADVGLALTHSLHVREWRKREYVLRVALDFIDSGRIREGRNALAKVIGLPEA